MTPILGYDTLATLPGLRAEAESRFTETFKVFTESRVLNESTGLFVTTETAIAASVAGRVKFPSLTVAERDQGAQVPAVQDVAVHVAVGAVSAPVGSFWRVLSSTADPSLVGRVFRTKGAPQAGQVTSHRFPVTAVS